MSDLTCPCCDSGLVAHVSNHAPEFGFRSNVLCNACGWSCFVRTPGLHLEREAMAQRVLDNIQANVSFHRNHWRC